MGRMALNLVNSVANTFQNVAISADNILSFEDKTFTIIYDEYLFEIVSSSMFENIAIEHDSAGTLIFTVDIDVPEMQMWSGVVDVIRFKGEQNGTSSIFLQVE